MNLEDIQIQYFQPDPKLEALEEKRLYKNLQDRAFLDDVMESEAWQIFREIWRRMAQDADEVLTKCEPTDVSKIAFAQATKRLYSEILPINILRIKEDSNTAVNALKEKGKLHAIKKRKRKAK